MVLSLGNDVEALVELDLGALAFGADHAAHFVFVGLNL
jgi:hypothetical protein